MALSMASTSSIVKSDAGFASFSGLRPVAPRAAAAAVSLPSKRCASLAVCASAEGSAEDIQVSESVAPQFASTSASPSLSSVPTAVVIPALVGAGLLGAASVAFFGGASGAKESGITAALPKAKRAAPAALATISAVFPNSMQEESFIKAVAAELFGMGFKKDNCIALVNTCRDEVCRPLVNLIDKEFGLSFNIAGLGGLINAGKTGFGAGMAHSPEFPCDRDGTPRERYIFFAFPHVSIGESGEVGSLLRRGRGKPSSACGALIAIKNDISKGSIAFPDDDDAEYVLLKKKVISKIGKPPLSGPSLVQVTKAALQAITEDLETLISATVDPAKADYAVITGVQIHSGNQIPGEPFRIERTCDYIAPNVMYAVIRGEKYILHCDVNQISSIKSVPVSQFA